MNNTNDTKTGLASLIEQADAQFRAGDRHATFNRQTIDSFRADAAAAQALAASHAECVAVLQKARSSIDVSLIRPGKRVEMHWIALAKCIDAALTTARQLTQGGGK